jgi:hypothetical protein
VSIVSALIFIFVDIPSLFPALLVVCSVYRLPIVWRKWETLDKYGMENRVLFWRQAFRVCCDLFVMPFAALVLITGYRFPHLLEKVTFYFFWN